MKALPVPLINIAKLLVIIVGTLVGLYLLIVLFSYLAPFVFAYSIATVNEPVVRWLSKKRRIKLSRSLAALVTTAISVILVATILFLAGSLFVSQATDIIKRLPEIIPGLQSNLTMFLAEVNAQLSILPEQYLQTIQNSITELGKVISTYTTGVALFVFDSATSLFVVFLFVVLTVLSTYFFSKDLNTINFTFKEQLPDSWIRQLWVIRCDIFAALIGYLKATIIFIVVTFVQLLIGFTILNVQYAFILAAIISLFDALPALGTGLFLIPWAIYAFIVGDIRLAVGLLIMNVVVVIVRQLISPKIFGEQFGVHPVTTMIFMYVGLKLLGVAGLILGPVILLVLKTVLGYYIQGRSFREVIFGEKN